MKADGHALCINLGYCFFCCFCFLFVLQYLADVGEMDFPRHKQTLHEVQNQNQTLQEQLVVQQDLFLELQQQLHESQRVSSQLRAQVAHPVPHPCELSPC